MKDSTFAAIAAIIALILAIYCIILRTKLGDTEVQLNDCKMVLEKHFEYDLQYNNCECQEGIYEQWDSNVPETVRELMLY